MTLADKIEELEGPDREVDMRFCKSCADKMTEASCFGIVTLENGRMIKWPLCDHHEPFAIIAGWLPVTRLPPKPIAAAAIRARG